MQRITSYAPLPVTFRHGKGVYLWDTEDRQYLDALSGITVSNLGHAHPHVVNAIKTQSEKLLHTSNIYHIEHQEALAEQLCKTAQLEQVFFCNSGTESVEAAIKVSRLYAHQKGIHQPKIIVMENAFHGRTIGALSATASAKARQGFEPLLEGFIRVPFNDIQAVSQYEQHDDVVAILVEPMQGEGGIRIPALDYLTQLRALCDRANWLLMLDEVTTGMGRTGQLFAHQHSQIQPDVMCLAKALANGLPIGACLLGKTASDLFTPGTHGATFGGNPMSTFVAKTVLDTYLQDNIVDHVPAKGQYLLDGIREIFKDHPAVKDIRGIGLMLGIELTKPCKAFSKAALAAGLLLSVTAENVIRIMPPLVITDSEMDELLTKLDTAWQQYQPQLSQG